MSVVNAAVELTLDGRKFQLQYRAFAFIAYAEETGRDLLTDLRKLGATLTATGGSLTANGGAVSGESPESANAAPAFGPMLGILRDVLWAGLIEGEPELKRLDVARMFSLVDLENIGSQILAAMMLTMPQSNGTAPAGPPKALKPGSRLNGGRGSGRDSENRRASAPENSKA